MRRPSGRFSFRVLTLLGLLFVGVVPACRAQRHLEKTYLDPSVNAIFISAEQAFQVVVDTSPTQEVIVEADMEGEYQNDVFIQMETLGNTLRIGTDFAPNFERPNDKLSAHKVLSVKLKIVLPENLKVSLVAGDCQVKASGNYRELNVKIAGGGCTLQGRTYRSDIDTISGFISAYIAEGQVLAQSGFGEVELESVPYGPDRYTLKSVRGSIRVYRQM